MLKRNAAFYDQRVRWCRKRDTGDGIAEDIIRPSERGWRCDNDIHVDDLDGTAFTRAHLQSMQA
jgi:hypothetical protein